MKYCFRGRITVSATTKIDALTEAEALERAIEQPVERAELKEWFHEYRDCVISGEVLSVLSERHEGTSCEIGDVEYTARRRKSSVR